MTVIARQEIFNKMIAHSKVEAPIEATGYLAGIRTPEGIIALEAYPMVNIDASAEHFSFSPEEQFRVMKEARGKGLEMVAVYHSHPATPARLSEEDIRLAYDPDMVHVIISLKDDKVDIKAFNVRDSAVSEVKMEVKRHG
ncbi:MAG: M67 family metallopeptidase [Candidatus Omnitrophica bacterium]|nr:M67 family metallopeptidase [Candidatus Omnitrophota bacterium]